MKGIVTVADVYDALHEVIPELDTAGESMLAATLSHRLYKVPWTTGSELLEELQRVLSDAVMSDARDLQGPLRDQLCRILSVINGYLEKRENW